jgi:hypothetical protein
MAGVSRVPDTHITEDMVETALLGAMGYDAIQDDDGPKGDDYFRGQMRAALEAALAGRTVVELPEPTHALVRTRIGVGRSLVALAYTHDEAITLVNVARRESELRDFIEIVPIERSGGSQVGDQHG